MPAYQSSQFLATSFLHAHPVLLTAPTSKEATLSMSTDGPGGKNLPQNIPETSSKPHLVTWIQVMWWWWWWWCNDVIYYKLPRTSVWQFFPAWHRVGGISSSNLLLLRPSRPRGDRDLEQLGTLTTWRWCSSICCDISVVWSIHSFGWWILDLDIKMLIKSHFCDVMLMQTSLHQ